MAVTELTTRPQQLNAATIDILREFLQMAEAGEIVSVAIVAVEPSGATRTQCAETDQFQSTLGGLEILKHRMLLDYLET